MCQHPDVIPHRQVSTLSHALIMPEPGNLGMGAGWRDVSSPPHISWAMPIRGAGYVLNLNNNRAEFGSHSKTMLGYGGAPKGQSQCRVIEMPRALRWWNSCVIGDTFFSQKWLQGLGSVGGSLWSHWFHLFCQEKNVLTMVYLQFFYMTSLRYCIKVQYTTKRMH